MGVIISWAIPTPSWSLLLTTRVIHDINQTISFSINQVHERLCMHVHHCIISRRKTADASMYREIPYMHIGSIAGMYACMC